ncbi:MAG: VCBS repeat-containing protein [Candidatus Latescibacterota bacterium]|jgi:hypothetical protein
MNEPGPDRDRQVDRALRRIVRQQQPRRGFVRRVMRSLPLPPWLGPEGGRARRLRPGQRWLVALGLGLAMWLGGESLWEVYRSWRPAGQQGGPPFGPPWVTDWIISPVDNGVFVPWVQALEESASLFSVTRPDPVAQRHQAEALLQGQGASLVWEFTSGDQGWRAREAPFGHVPRGLLPAAASEGVLRIPLGSYREGRTPVIELISPEIGYEARLFDRLEIRVRVVHDHPLTGGLGLTWSTPLNRLFPGGDPRFMERLEGAVPSASGKPRGRLSRFQQWLPGQVEYGPEWQDLTLAPLDQRPPQSFPPGEVEAPPLVWEGELVDLRLTLALVGAEKHFAVGAADYPQALEIDRIALRSGLPGAVSLPLPPAPTPTFAGQWLGPGRFHPLEQRALAQPILGDLDRDGDLDLVIGYSWTDRDFNITTGWITLLNQGGGQWAAGPAQVVDGGENQRSHMVSLVGADANGDGLLDLVVGKGMNTLIYLNQGGGIFRLGQEWENEYAAGAGDVDGDGAMDLVTAPYQPPSPGSDGGTWRWSTCLHRPKTGDGWTTETLSPPRDGDWFPELLADLDGNGRAELVWTCWPRGDLLEARLVVQADYHKGRWQRSTEIRFPQPAAVAHYGLWAGITYLGDLDRDGDWDLGAPLGILWEQGNRALGAEVYSGRPGTLPTPWLPRQVHLRAGITPCGRPLVVPQVQDLNRDGMTDPVFLDLNYRQGPALLLLRGRPSGLPQVEGRYALPADPRGWAAGDLDGDGAAELVVVVEGMGQAGFCVLPNQTGQGRAVTARLSQRRESSRQSGSGSGEAPTADRRRTPCGVRPGL